MPSAPGEFTTTVGGGADTVDAAMWKPIFGCWTTITNGPVGSVEARATAATGGMAASRNVDFEMGNGGAAAPPTPAQTRQAHTATPNAGLRAVRVSVCWTTPVTAEIAAEIFEECAA